MVFGYQTGNGNIHCCGGASDRKRVLLENGDAQFLLRIGYRGPYGVRLVAYMGTKKVKPAKGQRPLLIQSDA
jgi:hypothetical protein